MTYDVRRGLETHMAMSTAEKRKLECQVSVILNAIDNHYKGNRKFTHWVQELLNKVKEPINE